MLTVDSDVLCRVQKYDCGLGTTYERWALNQYLSRTFDRNHISSVLEGPDDGMTGIYGLNSIILGIQNIDVSLAFSDPEKVKFAEKVWGLYMPERKKPKIHLLKAGENLESIDQKFDLVWNFNVINRQPEPELLLQQMCDLSKSMVLVFVPNAKNYSFFLHRLQHKVKKQTWDHGSPSFLEAKPYRQMFRKMGFRVMDEVWVDCPWWPDIVNLSEFITDFFPFLKGISKSARPENRMLWLADSLPYYDSERFRAIHQKMEKLAFIEKSSYSWLKKRFAHHIGILAIREPL